jgi:hypothetical protein
MRQKTLSWSLSCLDKTDFISPSILLLFFQKKNEEMKNAIAEFKQKLVVPDSDAIFKLTTNYRDAEKSIVDSFAELQKQLEAQRRIVLSQLDKEFSTRRESLEARRRQEGMFVAILESAILGLERQLKDEPVRFYKNCFLICPNTLVG